MRRELIVLMVLPLVLAAFPGAAAAQRSSLHKKRNLEVGALFSLLPICDPNGLCDVFPRKEAGGGGRIAYNLNSHIAIEGEVDFFPRNYHRVVSNFTGGRIIEGLFGVKSGIKKKNFGIFAKGRPGFESSGSAEIAHFPNGNGADRQNPFGFEQIRSTQFALDMGGIFELYPSKRTIVRLDLGDTMVRYPRIPFTHFPDGTTVEKTVYSHKLQFSAGFSFRF